VFGARRELEEARKAGTAPAERDEDGKEINPHIPQYMSEAPWYLNVTHPGLKHLKNNKKQVAYSDQWCVADRDVDPSHAPRRLARGGSHMGGGRRRPRQVQAWRAGGAGRGQVPQGRLPELRRHGPKGGSLSPWSEKRRPRVPTANRSCAARLFCMGAQQQQAAAAGRLTGWFSALLFFLHG
jgi:hypothetical protein